MGLKDNFYQALRELFGGGGQAVSDTEEKARDSSAQDAVEYVDNVFRDLDENSEENTSVAGSDEVFPGGGEKSAQIGQFGRPNLFGRPKMPVRAEPSGQADSSDPADYSGGQIQPAEPVADPRDREMTFISKSTVVIGDIRSFANITIDGKVRGDVDVLKDATLHGQLVGDLMCGNSKIEGASVQGNVLAKGNAYIFNDSLLLGDLEAQYSNIDGKVRGNIDVGSRVNLYRNAIVAGNINTGTITVEEGANLKGYVNTSFLAEHGDTAFPGKIMIEDADDEV